MKSLKNNPNKPHYDNRPNTVSHECFIEYEDLVKELRQYKECYTEENRAYEQFDQIREQLQGARDRLDYVRKEHEVLGALRQYEVCYAEENMAYKQFGETRNRLHETRDRFYNLINRYIGQANMSEAVALDYYTSLDYNPPSEKIKIYKTLEDLDDYEAFCAAENRIYKKLDEARNQSNEARKRLVRVETSQALEASRQYEACYAEENRVYKQLGEMRQQLRRIRKQLHVEIEEHGLFKELHLRSLASLLRDKLK